MIAYCIGAMLGVAGCTTIEDPVDSGLTPPDIGIPADMGATEDAGHDGGSDSGVRPGVLTVFGAIGSVGGASSAGELTVVDQAFEAGGFSCAGALCVSGGITP